MDEEMERLVIGVRADTGGLARDLAEVRASLAGGLGDAAEMGGRRIETALVRALRTGKLGFGDLKSVALSTMDAIANATLRNAIGTATRSGGGIGATLGALVSGLLGAPGRATGGPVSPARPFLVGERGPELFVPTASGRIETGGFAAAGAREVRVAITVNGGGDNDRAGTLARSGRQVARAVRRALEQAEG